MVKARRASKASAQTEHIYAKCAYEANSWEEERRVIIKAEVVRHAGREPKDNPRFVVTNSQHRALITPAGRGKGRKTPQQHTGSNTLTTPSHCCPVNRNKKGLNLNELLQCKCDQTLQQKEI